MPETKVTVTKHKMPKAVNDKVDDYSAVKAEEYSHLYKVKPKVGRVPEEINGLYTSKEAVFEAVRKYIDKKKANA